MVHAYHAWSAAVWSGIRQRIRHHLLPIYELEAERQPSAAAGSGADAVGSQLQGVVERSAPRSGTLPISQPVLTVLQSNL